MKKIFSGFLTGAALIAASVTASADEIQQFIIDGQSLSTGDQSWPPLSTENVPGNYMMGVEIWINGGTANRHGYGGDDGWDFRPLKAAITSAFKGFTNNHTRNGAAIAECPLHGAVNHMQSTFLKGKPILATSVGVSGSAIEELSKECTQRHNYADFLTSLGKAVEESRKAGYDKISCPAIFWMQGEFNYTVKGDHCGLNAGEDNCIDTKTYKELLVKLKNNMQADIVSAYGQAKKPVLITYQTGGQYVRDKIAIGMAQLQAANENEDIIMAGSPYPSTDRGGHLDANGYRWFGEMLAKAYYKSQVLGEDATPLQPKKIMREDGGRTIRIRYHVPVGPLKFDTNIIPKIKNYGFNVYKNTYGESAAQKFKSIEIEGDDVVIKFDEPLTGKIIVTYADPWARIENQPAGLDHLQGHGNLRDSDPYQSAFTYVDLDAKNPDGSYAYHRETSETRLRPDYEPKDENGNVIYGKPYPLYNFGVAFYYTLGKNADVLEILDENNKPAAGAVREPGDLDVAYVDAVNGSDTNVGSAAAPFASLAKAVAAVKWDGAKVVVKGAVEFTDELNLEGYTSLTLEGEGSDATLDGLGKNRLAETEYVNITLRNLNFVDCHADGEGGVFNMKGGNLTVENCKFDGCNTSRMKDENGGVFNLNFCGDINISDCSFTDNTAFRGGVIYVNQSKQLTVTGSLFDSNKSIRNPAESNPDSRGAAISLWGTNVDIDNCVFSNNESSNQCGVFQIGPNSTADLHFTVKNCDILDNKAPKDHGGVFVAENGGQRNYVINFINCTISGNTNGGVGSVAWILNDNNGSDTQNINFYNCTITGNHNTGGTFNSTINIWESNHKVHFVNTILEGNTCGGNKEYCDLHAGEFSADKSGNITVQHSVIGKFITMKRDNIGGKEIGTPVCDEYSQFNISPNSVSDGEANYAGLKSRDENGAHIFASVESKGVGMGSDKMLADKYGITTDRFGKTRRLNCIGSVEMIEGYSGLQMVTAEDKNLGISLDGDILRVVSPLCGDSYVLEVFTVDGRKLASVPAKTETNTLRASVLGTGIFVLRITDGNTSRSALFRL